jgi:asparagine synthase (glutamine-hydrolysing)
MAARGEPHEVDIDSLYAFLMIGWIPTPHSMFRGIEKVPAGTILEFRRGVFETTTYYDVPHRAGDVVSRSPAQLSREVTEHLDRSVERGLALGGRWGSFLSGGVDSSSVVASIGHQTESAFPTYFGGFAPQLNQYLPNPEEPEMSRLVSETCGSEHHMLWLGPEAVDRTSEVVGALEEPVCDGGCIVLAAVMEEAQGVADGLMTGIGGDFLFTGERRHKVLGLLRYMRPVPTPIWRLATASLGMPFVAKNARASQAHFDLTRLVGLQGMPLPEMYAGFFLQAEPSELEELFEPSAYSALARDPLAEMKSLFAEAAEIDPIAQFLYLDLKTQSTEHCLREAETLGRHFGLLVHNPLVDADFVDFAMTVPSSAKVARLQLKLPLRDAMRSRLPDRVLDRKKGGLGSPIRWWVTQPTGAVADRLSESHLGGRGIVRPEVIERFRALTASGAKDYSKLLWSLFTLELWFERFVDSAPATESVRP